MFLFFRDAAWETEENAFHELTVRPSQCNADECICADGRQSDKPSNELIICETCGSSCIHQNCWQRREPYYCCFPIDLKDATSSNERPTNNRLITSKKSEMIVEIRRKRKRAHQTDDEKLDEKRRKKRKTDTFPEYAASDKRKKGQQDCGSKVNSTKNDFVVNSNFPITSIRNGSFDQILRYNPRVLLYPLSLESFNVSCKKFVETSNSNRSLTTSNIDANVNNNNLKSSSFAVISPSKKKGGKSFKNYMITSFFKPHD